jgi:high-affinity iron transporter
MSTFLVTLREGAEAALIVAIAFTYLRSLGRLDQARWLWGGAGAAVVAAAAAGVALHLTIGTLEGRAEEVVEGVVALTAVALLTWMVFWMAARAARLRPLLEGKVTAAVGGGGWALAAVGFVAVLREGLETALFLIAAGSGAGGAAHWLGGLGGLAAAAIIGFAVYRGGRRLDLGLFFRVTAVLIVLFAAGLVAKGVHEFQEAGLLPALLDPVWDLGFGDPGGGVGARVASEVFGWTPSPSLLQVLAYWAYLLPVALAFRSRTRRSAASPAEGAAVEAGASV